MTKQSTTPYSETARDYFLAAEILWQKEKHEQLPIIAPCSYCLCHGIELFLKDLLLRRDFEPKKVKHYGHDIYQMWRLDEFAKMRGYAQDYALGCAGVKPEPYTDPNEVSVDETIRLFNELYGAERDYALKYPTSKTMVPYPQPLIWVFYELIDDPRWGG